MDRDGSTVRVPTGIFWILGIKSIILVFIPIQDIGAEQMVLPKLFAIVCAITSFASIWLISKRRREVKNISVLPFASIALALISMTFVGGNSVSLGIVVAGIMVIGVSGFITSMKVREFVQQLS